jgi:hypothetical protein
VLRIARNDMRMVSGVLLSSAPMRGPIEDNVLHCAGGTCATGMGRSVLLGPTSSHESLPDCHTA